MGVSLPLGNHSFFQPAEYFPFSPEASTSVFCLLFWFFQGLGPLCGLIFFLALSPKTYLYLHKSHPEYWRGSFPERWTSPTLLARERHTGQASQPPVLVQQPLTSLLCCPPSFHKPLAEWGSSEPKLCLPKRPRLFHRWSQQQQMWERWNLAVFLPLREKETQVSGHLKRRAGLQPPVILEGTSEGSSASPPPSPDFCIRRQESKGWDVWGPLSGWLRGSSHRMSQRSLPRSIFSTLSLPLSSLSLAVFHVWRKVQESFNKWRWTQLLCWASDEQKLNKASAKSQMSQLTLSTGGIAIHSPISSSIYSLLQDLLYIGHYFKK